MVTDWRSDFAHRYSISSPTFHNIQASFLFFNPTYRTLNSKYSIVLFLLRRNYCFALIEFLRKYLS